MRKVEAQTIMQAVDVLCRQACSVLPDTLVHALNSAAEAERAGSAAQTVLHQLVDNAALAASAARPCCQDTGMAVVFLDIGMDAHIEGDVYAAVNAGVKKAYTEAYMRFSVLDPLTRKNTGDNTPAVTHIRFVPGDAVRIAVMPKGFGSENMSRLFMLSPADGRDGVRAAIVRTVREAGACACPPVIVGVGIGGTMESAALLAKRQLLRPLGEPSADALAAALEEDALRDINALQIGPMGLGGKTTALAVHIGTEKTHIAGLPVAVNLCCHAWRHAERTL